MNETFTLKTFKDENKKPYRIFVGQGLFDWVLCVSEDGYPGMTFYANPFAENAVKDGICGVWRIIDVLGRLCDLDKENFIRVASSRFGGNDPHYCHVVEITSDGQLKLETAPLISAEYMAKIGKNGEEITLIYQGPDTWFKIKRDGKTTMTGFPTYFLNLIEQLILVLYFGYAPVEV